MASCGSSAAAREAALSLPPESILARRNDGAERPRFAFWPFRIGATLGTLLTMPTASKRAPEKLLIAAAGRRIPVAIKRNPRARRLILRVDEALGLPVLTLPTRTSRLIAPPAPFEDGATFPLRGLPCRVRAISGRGVASLERRGEGYLLTVPGEPEFLARRISDFLRREARRDLTAAVARHEAAIGRRAAKIRIADPKSRWGSCSSARVLTFSWRLILAPPRVLDYLAAHEVAHLRIMNHGPRFWTLVDELDPDNGIARAWLNKAGVGLSAVGRSRP
jgi:predicted metal-dependent hydrolase